MNGNRSSLCLQNVEFVRTGYGKNKVKVLVIRRQGSHHYIIELKVDVELTLKSRKDYLTGDNSDIIPTDTIKNTVHGLAKLKGVRSSSRPSTTLFPLSTRVTLLSLHKKQRLSGEDFKTNIYLFVRQF